MDYTVLGPSKYKENVCVCVKHFKIFFTFCQQFKQSIILCVYFHVYQGSIIKLHFFFKVKQSLKCKTFLRLYFICWVGVCVTRLRAERPNWLKMKFHLWKPGFGRKWLYFQFSRAEVSQRCALCILWLCYLYSKYPPPKRTDDLLTFSCTFCSNLKKSH